MRNENYDRELLAFVLLFCAVFAIAVSVLDTPPPSASSPSARSTQAAIHTQQSERAAVRVIGTPFVPNTNPSIR